MKINSEMVQQLRKEASWSQEELAAASGLSPRTIQRVEVEGVASIETKKALAVVFALQPKDLELGDPANDPRRVQFGMGILATWIGIVWLLNLGWGIGLIGAGLIYLSSQIRRVFMDKLPIQWEWIGIGTLVILGGLNSLFSLEVRFGPISVIIAGLVLILTVRNKKLINSNKIQN